MLFNSPSPDLSDIGMRDVVMKTSFLFLVLCRPGSGFYLVLVSSCPPSCFSIFILPPSVCFRLLRIAGLRAVHYLTFDVVIWLLAGLDRSILLWYLAIYPPLAYGFGATTGPAQVNIRMNFFLSTLTSAIKIT
jgi:hypothetical protein